MVTIFRGAHGAGLDNQVNCGQSGADQCNSVVRCQVIKGVG